MSKVNLKFLGQKRSLYLGLGILLLGFAYVGLPFLFSTSYQAQVVKGDSSGQSQTPKEKPFVVTHVASPDVIKGIYMTACVAGTPSWRERLAQLVKNTELNSIVIDIKDYSGTISFIDPALQGDDVTGCRVKDMREYVDELHQNNVYVIGRVTVFQDPYYAKRHPELAVKSKATGGVWKDKNGLPFIDVGAKPYWDRIVDIAKAGYALGFDEINFDYIRYPSDGNMADAKYTWTIGTSTGSTSSPLSKAEMVKSFFSYLYDHLKDTGMKTSADLFGLTTVAEDDLGIGQVLVNTLPYFDYVDPMVYPSHFAPGADGYKSPAEHPYEIVHYSMLGGLNKENILKTSLGISTSTPSKLRPWLQDFDLLGVPYGVPEVQAQMKATYDIGLTSWLLWDAGNKYTPGALKME
jgi:hypothetical protein